jgi:hypothetical protein
MWFMFGGITLIFIISYRFLNYYFSLWLGKTVLIENASYEYKKKKSRSGIVSLKIGVRTSKKLNFILRRENWWDQYFKSINLAWEHQVGWKKFDDEIYVESDSEAVLIGFLNNKATQRSLLKLFKSGFDNRIRINKLQCNSGRLWVEIDNFGSLNSEKDEYELIARDLLELAEKLNKIDIKKHSGFDPYFLKSSLLLAVSSGLLINAILQVSRINILVMPITLDKAGLVAFSILGGTIITGILAVSAWNLLKNSSRAHLVLLEIFTFGYLGAIGSSAAQIREMNSEWDNSSPIRYESNIVKKSIEEGRKGSKIYTLYLSAWSGEKNANGLAVNVTGSMYYRVSKGFPVAIVQHEGYLGLNWIKSIHALKLLKARSKQKYEVVSEEEKFRRKHKLSGFARY